VDRLAQYFIEDTGGDPSVQVPGPALVLFAGREFSSDSFSVSLELQLQADGITRSAAETAVIIIICI
jgi:hypothetical protein